jgi:ABC-type Mn2+/Zn2+ transport system permease subunit
MTAKTKTILKKILAYVLASVLLMLIYFVIAFILDLIFNLFGDEDEISIISTAATCIFLTVIFVVCDIINNRKKGIDRSDDIIKICRRILTTTTYMFCGMLLVEWLIQKLFSDKDFSLGLVHWLSFALAVALFDELVKKYKEKKGEKTDN